MSSLAIQNFVQDHIDIKVSEWNPTRIHIVECRVAHDDEFVRAIGMTRQKNDLY